MFAAIAFAVLALGSCSQKIDKPEEEEPQVTWDNLDVKGSAVDLGLSAKWADHNVGATLPEENGYFFAWGETVPKTFYSWATYKLCKGTWNSICKYNNDPYYGEVDGKTRLEAEDDAATANWGSVWRMPTAEEMEELRTRCTWKRTTINNSPCYEVTSKVNGNMIIVPAVGYINDDRVSPGACYYWTADVMENNTGFAMRLYQNNDGTNTGSNYRIHGIPVRPVYNE